MRKTRLSSFPFERLCILGAPPLPYSTKQVTDRPTDQPTSHLHLTPPWPFPENISPLYTLSTLYKHTLNVCKYRTKRNYNIIIGMYVRVLKYLPSQQPLQYFAHPFVSPQSARINPPEKNPYSNNSQFHSTLTWCASIVLLLLLIPGHPPHNPFIAPLPLTPVEDNHFHLLLRCLL